MDQKEYIKAGLDGEAPLKVIMRGSVVTVSDERVGVVSVIYATMDRAAAAKRIAELQEEENDSYYMVYSVPLDTDLTGLDHFPSIAITKADLER